MPGYRQRFCELFHNKTEEFTMKCSISYFKILCGALLVLGGYGSQVAAQELFSDDFEDRERNDGPRRYDRLGFTVPIGGGNSVPAPLQSRGLSRRIVLCMYCVYTSCAHGMAFYRY